MARTARRSSAWSWAQAARPKNKAAETRIIAAPGLRQPDAAFELMTSLLDAVQVRRPPKPLRRIADERPIAADGRHSFGGEPRLQ